MKNIVYKSTTDFLNFLNERIKIKTESENKITTDKPNPNTNLKKGLISQSGHIIAQMLILFI